LGGRLISLPYKNPGKGTAAETAVARRLSKPIDFRSEDEIAFRQTVNLVRPDCDFRSTPTKANVRMMPLRFGEFTHSINKRLRLFEIPKLVFSAQVMFVYNFPAVELGLQFRYLLTSQRRHSAATRNTLSTR
jgi:hypothetical protein